MLPGARALTLVVAALSAACLVPGCVDSKCYRNEDCPTGQICQTMTGACTAPECTAHTQCPTGKLCENSACVTGCQFDLECTQGMKCVQNRCAVIENACGCALATRFCLPDMNASSPTYAKQVCVPDAAPGGTLIFFGSVLCSHCLGFFSDLDGVRQKLQGEGLAPKFVWSQWSGVMVTPQLVQQQLGGANLPVLQDTAELGMWPAYHANWYYVAVLETHGCVGWLYGPLAEETRGTWLPQIEEQWRKALTPACP